MQSIYFILFLTCCCLAAALEDKEVQKEWLQFKQKYAKSYQNYMEEKIGYLSFKKNLEIITQHNDGRDNSFQMGLNPYSDKDFKYMETNLMGLKITKSDQEKFLKSKVFVNSSLSTDIPESMDWRSAGAVTPVKNQGQCGSCWAFAAICALESQHFIKTHNQIRLSEQNLVDCDKQNGGCSGGWMETAYIYIRDNDGIDTEASYPYTGKDGQCNFKRENVGARCSGYTNIASGNENDLKEAVATRGPIAVAIEATGLFQGYKSGILDDTICRGNVNHAVVIVGYGTENGRDYWLVKNSWGTGWGEEGYIKMSRNKNNQCAIASYAVYPNVEVTV